MVATTAHAYRVACAEHAVPCPTEHAATQLRDAIERLASCHEFHRVEAHVDGEWVPVHIVRTRKILAAPCGTAVETFEGEMVVNHRANVVDGVAESATLTRDGREAISEWCSCDHSNGDDWAYFERYTAEGRASHGYVCAFCRRITQTG